MKRIFISLILCFLISCNLSTTKKKTIIENIPYTDSLSKFSSKKVENKNLIINRDTIWIINDIVLSIHSTATQIDSLKKKYKKNIEDFYTIADDANFYMAEAHSFLEGKRKGTLHIKEDKIIIFNKKDTIKTKKLPPWVLILYSKNKRPKVIHPIDIEQEYTRYFDYN